MKEKIRVPSTTVELVQIFGTIFRDHLKIRQFGTECWTFQQVADYEVRSKQDVYPGADYKQVEHSNSVYLGEGSLKAQFYTTDTGNAEKVEIRTRCEHNNWEGAALKSWTIELWLKPENGEIRRYFFFCNKGYGFDRDICLFDDKVIPNFPPNKIAFKANKGDGK